VPWAAAGARKTVAVKIVKTKPRITLTQRRSISASLGLADPSFPIQTCSSQLGQQLRVD